VNSKERRENLISEVTILLDPRVQFLTKNKTYKETVPEKDVIQTY
jgi:hypothetical protein